MSLHDIAAIWVAFFSTCQRYLVDRWAKKDNFQFEPDQPIVVKEIQHPLLQAR